MSATPVPAHESPLVTVVTPTLNRVGVLQRAIESVLSQDYPAIEYLVMDGGSTDGTLELLRRYGERIRWRSARDGGQAHAINTGWRWGRGEILAWLNDDDQYEPGAVTEAVAVFRQHPEAGLVYGSWRCVDAAGGAVGVAGPTEPFELTVALAEFMCPVPQPSAFVRRSAVERVGMLDSQLHYCMDFDLWLRIAWVMPVVNVNRCWSINTIHPHTKSRAQVRCLSRDFLKCVENFYTSAQLPAALRGRRLEAEICARWRACWMCVASRDWPAALWEATIACLSAPHVVWCSPGVRRYLSFIRSELARRPPSPASSSSRPEPSSESAAMTQNIPEAIP